MFIHLFAAMIFLLGSLKSQAKPTVLSSLKPLTLIVQEIAGDKANIDTLLPASASHHDYPLKASDHARLRAADLVIWVGPELESFLQKPIANLAPAKILTTYSLAGLNWPQESLKVVEEDHHHGKDPHIWLDPRNALVIARALTQKLVKLDGVNGSYYQAKLQIFAAKITSLDDKLRVKLKPASDVGFAVYHEGFAHFVSRYNLRQLDYVMLTPEKKPGAKHMHRLRESLAKEGSCLFLEPYNNTQGARSLAQELRLRIGTLDALGVQGATTYSQLLEQMATDFSTCLTN